MRRVLLLIAAAALLGACTTDGPGQAAAAPTPTATATGPIGLVLPPRPRELPLDGVDPCALLTPEQREMLGLNDNSVRSTTTARVFAGPTCSIRGDEPRAISVGFALATDSGIEALTSPGTTTDEITPITVQGFPAILARPPIPDFCSVDVDVAEGQFLDVIFRDGGRLPPIPQDQLCRDAVEVAEQAVGTLLAR
ncbi:DUF3558 domain-containing protein [Pseudonocardia nigra]|uniref:DUF3558 domain-containing protein n=1 Tax=Pseudonocardia nigra TaxID=1921578 RepID=UPI001C5F0B36|nr:DUF3558 domain-containing protein [Pseudonocardia nigra]